MWKHKRIREFVIKARDDLSLSYPTRRIGKDVKRRAQTIESIYIYIDI